MSERAERVLAWLWPVLLTLVITAPLLAPGYVVGYDMVFVPDLTVRLDLFGVTTAMPRAVPSDVVVAVLDDVVGGQVLNKVVLVAIPLLSGLGMTALWRELRLGTALPGAAAVTLFMWNPFLAERLRLGAWALLLGYAALPWLVRSAVRLRKGTGWPGFLLASAGCALTASGGITGLVLAALILLWPGRGRVWPLGGAALLNAPWLVAGLVHGGNATVDPASVTAFAARDEGYGGALPTLLTLGGVWNADVVPGNRGDLIPVIFAFVMLLMSVAGAVLWWRQDRIAGALVVAAGLAVVIGMAGVVAPGFFADVVASVPGAGLFRDGQRYLAPLVLLEAVGFGVAVHALRQRIPLHRVVGATAVLLPIAALPTLVGGPGLNVSQYPSDWGRAQRVLAGPFIPWPFESYRAPVWNGRRPVRDPMPRYFDPPAIVPDELIVGGHRLAGEDPRATAVATAVRAAMRTGADPTPVLLEQGVGWLVVDREAGGPPPRDSIAGLTEEYAGLTVSVYRLAGTPATQRPDAWRTAVVLGAWVLAGATLMAALAGLVTRRSMVWRRR
ncbi:hypothetical protein E1218_15770 [Kribbella turkmenica]|uniref:Transmembrane protein n=1 Tax=Kribbella turkmenica TaxID=2530375 RepID=A0A4R4X3W8_9ACTN|nr:hypothetical protein [Kribbella turkmenica]TDD24980.1 hypothetical protein E1218_15770 [Kribbella turkmenica]